MSQPQSSYWAGPDPEPEMEQRGASMAKRGGRERMSKNSDKILSWGNQRCNQGGFSSAEDERRWSAPARPAEPPPPPGAAAFSESACVSHRARIWQSRGDRACAESYQINHGALVRPGHPPKTVALWCTAWRSPHSRTRTFPHPRTANQASCHVSHVGTEENSRCCRRSPSFGRLLRL
eukprot:356243-Chlamydomonas_euryale.AAC.5